MKKLSSLVVLIVVASTMLKSQELKTDWGSSLDLQNNFRSIVYVDSTGATFFLTIGKNGDYFIERQNAGESKASSVVKVISSEQNSPKLNRLFIAKAGIAVISTITDKKASTMTYFYNIVTFDSKLQFSEEQKFLTINVNQKEWPGTSMVLISPDKSRIAVSFRGTETQVFKWYGFDGDFKPLFTKESGMFKNSKFGLVSAGNFSISNNGDLTYYCEKATIKKKNKPEGSELWLYVLTGLSNTTDSVAIKPAGKHFTSLSFMHDGDKLVVFGLYSDKYTATGTYFSIYSVTDKKLIVETNTALEVKHFVTPGAIGRKNEIPGFGSGALKIIKNKDGYYIISDPVFAQASQAPGGGRTLMYTLYNMYVFSLSVSGDINWISTIYRDQICKEVSGVVGIGGPLSVGTSVMLRQDDISLFGSVSAIIGDNLVIVMNDAAANAPQPTDAAKLDAVRKTKELTAQTVVVSADGKVDKKIVKDNNGNNTRWHASYSHVNHGSIYTIGEDGESTRLVRIY